MSNDNSKQAGTHSNDDKETQAEKLIRLASTRFTLFHDSGKDGYAFVNGNSILIRSSAFKDVLTQLLWTQGGDAPSSETLNQAVRALNAMAQFDMTCIPLYNRVAGRNGNFYYDLGDGNAVELTSDGWSIIQAPIIFRRFSHQQKQVHPVQGGSAQEIFKFLNLLTADDRLLLLVYIISCFIPDIPHPILHPYGHQGSGKSTLCKIAKRIIDPSQVNLMMGSIDKREIPQILSQHYWCAFDNMSSCSNELSDLFSQACTGSNVSKRQLYTDSDSVILRLKSCIAINGINQLVSRPDLMDRILLIKLDRITEQHRLREGQMRMEFEKSRPIILGGMFDAIVSAMSICPTIIPESMPRMADFYVWGLAITEALGYNQSDFVSAYGRNISAKNEAILNNNSLLQALLILMEDHNTWTGIVSELLIELQSIVRPHPHDYSFPKYPNKLRGEIQRIRPVLQDYGLQISFGSFRTNRGVTITISKNIKPSALSTPPAQSTQLTLTDPDADGSVITLEVDEEVHIP